MMILGCCLSKDLYSAQKPHIDAVYRILTCLKLETGKKLLYAKHNNMDIKMFIDADWTSCKTDCKCTI